MPIFLISFVLCSCINNQKIVHKKYEFEKMYDDNHVFSFELYLENLNGPENISNLVNELIYNGKNFDEYREYIEQKFIQDTVRNNYPVVINEDGTAYINHSEYNENYSIVFRNDQFIIFENKLWFYKSGMAHGNYSINYFIIDLPEKKILDRNELLNQIPEKLLIENITKKHEVNNFLRSNIWPPDTINFNNGVVEFFWNTYSILPYVDGVISVELKKEAVGQYLTETGKKLLAMTEKR